MSGQIFAGLDALIAALRATAGLRDNQVDSNPLALDLPGVWVSLSSFDDLNTLDDEGDAWDLSIVLIAGDIDPDKARQELQALYDAVTVVTGPLKLTPRPVNVRPGDTRQPALIASVTWTE